mgnify:FL=1
MSGIACVLVNGFGDEHLLPALAYSVRPLGCPVLYGDGAWELFLEPGESASGDVDALRVAFDDMDLHVLSRLPVGSSSPWSSDAAKKT